MLSFTYFACQPSKSEVLLQSLVFGAPYVRNEL